MGESAPSSGTRSVPERPSGLDRLKGRTVVDKTKLLFCGRMRVHRILQYTWSSGIPHGVHYLVLDEVDRSREGTSILVGVGSDGDVFDLLTRLSSPDLGGLKAGPMSEDYKLQFDEDPK